jgi:hypothetical protein
MLTDGILMYACTADVLLHQELFVVDQSASIHALAESLHSSLRRRAHGKLLSRLRALVVKGAGGVSRGRSAAVCRAAGSPAPKQI